MAGTCGEEATVTVFYTGTLGVGTHLFTDAGLTTPVTASSIMEIPGEFLCGELFTVDPSTGIVLADLGITCCDGSIEVDNGTDSDIVNVAGISGSSPFDTLAGTNFYGPQTGFTSSIDVTINPGPTVASTLTLFRNGTLLSVSPVVAGFIGTKSFPSFTYGSTDYILITYQTNE